MKFTKTRKFQGNPEIFKKLAWSQNCKKKSLKFWNSLKIYETPEFGNLLNMKKVLKGINLWNLKILLNSVFFLNLHLTYFATPVYTLAYLWRETVVKKKKKKHILGKFSLSTPPSVKQLRNPIHFEGQKKLHTPNNLFPKA